MKRLLVMTTVLAALAVPAVVLALDISAHNKSVVCTVQNTSVHCEGYIAGLGNLSSSGADFLVSVPYVCSSSGTNPPGQQQFVTGNEQNVAVGSNGEAYLKVDTSASGCHDSMTNFIGPATIHIYYPGTTNDVHGSPIFVALS
jgi:hypothetical protein